MNARRLIFKTLYWLAVIAVSLAIVFMLVLLFESLDDSSVREDGDTTGPGLILLR